MLSTLELIEIGTGTHSRFIFASKNWRSMIETTSSNHKPECSLSRLWRLWPYCVFLPSNVSSSLCQVHRLNKNHRASGLFVVSATATMSKAKSNTNKETNELLDNLSKGKETTSTEQALYVANGLVVSLAPVCKFDSTSTSHVLDLYVTIFGLSFRENAIAFLALTALVGFLLSKAYEAVTTNVYNAFSRTR